MVTVGKVGTITLISTSSSQLSVIFSHVKVEVQYFHAGTEEIYLTLG